MLSSLRTSLRVAGPRFTSAPGAMLLSRSKHTLPELPYEYDALEPSISGEIMKIHHSKHHQTYVNNYNVAEEKLATAVGKEDVNDIISLQSALKFNGGGHLNHSIFWTNLAPTSQGGGKAPEGPLLEAINEEFGSLDGFKDKFSAASAAVQGSGWGWLGYNPSTKRIQIATTSNQDPLQAIHGLIPLLGVDVWEHAYYLQYKNVRPDYLKEIWKVVNWKNVTERFERACSA